MPRWHFNGQIEDNFDDEDFEVTDSYTGFEKFKHHQRSEEELKSTKKRQSIKHQKREDKE